MEQTAPSLEQSAAIPSRVVQPLVVPPVERLPAARRGTLRLTGAMLLALVLHGAALATLIVAIDATTGDGGKTIDVVEVSLVPAEALEPGAGQSAKSPGGADAAARLEAAPSPDANAANGPVPSLDQKPDRLAELPAPPRDMALPASPDGIDAPTRSQTGATTPEPTGAARDQAASTAAEGRATSISNALLREDAAAAAPADGEVDAYNRTVAVTLAKLKPKGIGESGLAKIVFRIGSTGSVDDVKLALSTGKSKLDRLATDTVARAKFEVPPAGMTTAQLTYAIAFRFR